MSTHYTTKVKRADGTTCLHPADTDCARCLEENTRPVQMPTVLSFPETVYEHMFGPDETPYPVSSREQLRRECNERGLISNYLRESIIHKSGPDRWV